MATRSLFIALTVVVVLSIQWPARALIRASSAATCEWDFMGDPIWPMVTCSDLEDAVQDGFTETLHGPQRYDLNRTLAVCRTDSNLLGARSWSLALKKASMSIDVSASKLLKPIEFLHVSKSAGTYFCNCMSGPNGMGFNKAHPYSRATNCHILREDWPLWGRHDVPGYAMLGQSDVHVQGCVGKLSLYKEAQIDVEGVENYVARDGLCTEFTNVAILRDPMSRLVSHLMQIQKELFVWDPAKALKNMVVDDVISTWPIVSDNYYIRSLLGFDVFELPAGQINTVHFQTSKHVLSAYDHVMIADASLSEDVFRQLGFNCSGTDGRHCQQDTGTHISSSDLLDQLRTAWGEKGWARLTWLNRFDIELFKYATTLRFIQTSSRGITQMAADIGIAMHGGV